MFSKLLAKISGLSKSDKKLLITVSVVAVGLVFAVILATYIGSLLRQNAGYEIELAAENDVLESGTAGMLFTNEQMEFSVAPTALGDILIEAVSISEYGIYVDTGFLVSSETRTLDVEHLTNYLSVRSGEIFSLEEQGGNVFLLNFEEELLPNRVYNFIYQPSGYAPASHAFQTVDAFRVVSTTPSHNTHGVPSDTGIEITFSRPIEGGIDAFSAAFSIEPMVDGRFINRENTYIFVPSFLNSNTMYTVTISLDAEDYTFAFTTGVGEEVAFSVAGDAYETFLPWNEVFIAMNVSPEFGERDFIVELIDVQTPENFLNFADIESTNDFHVRKFEIELRTFEGEWLNTHFLFLEQTLPEGYYVAKIRSEHSYIVAHKFIQISSISVYSLSVEGESVFWVHDASTGQPAQGATIRADGETVHTDSEGIAVINTRENRRAVITIEYANYLPFVYFKPIFDNRTLIPGGRFLSYMYTDRANYRPNDTIDVFGVIMPRYGHFHYEGDVFTLRVGDMIRMPIVLDAFNSFAMRIPISNMFGSADITVEVNGERLMSAWVGIFDYTNLSFVITGEVDRLVYEPGEYARAEVMVTTFAGRPVEDATVTIFPDAPSDVRTNAYGIAHETIQIGFRNPGLHWLPLWSSFWVTVADDAQAVQGVSLPFIIMPRNVMLEYELSGASMTVRTHEISRSRLEQEKRNSLHWEHISTEDFRGEIIDIDFSVEISRHTTTRTIGSQQYDHINRRVITTYNFNTTQSYYRTIRGRTENGVARIEGLPISDDPMINYQKVIRYHDTNGRETAVSVFGGWRRTPHNASGFRHFHFPAQSRILRIGETTLIPLVESPERWWWEESEYSIVEDGRMLVIKVRDGVISVAAGSPQGIPITFTEEGVSNALLFGAYFDGQNIFAIRNPLSLLFNTDERELGIELEFDREIYRPGGDVTVEIQTSLPNAQVLLSVVDESALQGSWHEADFRHRLYRSSQVWLWGMNAFQFTSHRRHYLPDGNFDGGNGFGGGDEAGGEIAFREFFVDNPIFETVITDENGRANLTFTLPDQITSWRVTAIGITEDGFAGDTRANIISSLDFYVNLILTNEFIVGDDIAAVARAYGTGYSPVNFIFNVSQNNEVILTSSATSSFGREVFNAGKLPPGEYKMQVLATYSGLSDGVELPFTVVESAMIIQSRVSGEISMASPNITEDLNMRNLPVRITFTNANIRPLTDILHRTANSNSFRTDAIAAAAFADYFFTGEAETHAVSSRVHARNGGIPELFYEEPSLGFTARFAASFPEHVNREQIIRYVNAPENTASHSQNAMRLLALAAIDEPVLHEIRNYAAATDESDIFAALYLAAALVSIGDDYGAQELLQRVSIPLNLSYVEMELAYTLKFFINTAIDPIAAWEHAQRYNQNEYVSDIPEKINFVRRIQFSGGTVSEFQYNLNEESHTVRLENFDRLHLHLLYEQFTALNLTPIRGETEYSISFYTFDSNAWNPDDNRIEITRTIEPDGDLFLVTLTVNLPPDARGNFVIYDRLPSNLRFVPRRQRFEPRTPWFSVHNTQRQLVELHLFANHTDPLTRTLTYHAMELFDAEMSDGTTYITNHRLDNHIWGRS
ncbi:MAG: Ig-like domain-containing protein [Defluviitaleaceae bacterium]|nr:Ig-like domain-containing protein [Defluviitaleaceae bacterium]